MGSVAQVSFGCGIGEMIGWSGGRWTIGGGTHGRIIPWDTFPTVRTGRLLNPKSPHSNSNPSPVPSRPRDVSGADAFWLSSVGGVRSATSPMKYFKWLRPSAWHRRINIHPEGFPTA